MWCYSHTDGASHAASGGGEVPAGGHTAGEPSSIGAVRSTVWVARAGQLYEQVHVHVYTRVYAYMYMYMYTEHFIDYMYVEL